MEERYYLGFSAFPGIGPVKFSKLLKRCLSAENAWNAEEKLLAEIIGSQTAEKFTDFRNSFSLAEYEEKLAEKKIQYCISPDESYPSLLGSVKFPPFVLYYKGDIRIGSQKSAIGVVGTRKISTYGRQVTQMITTELVDAGFVIVSGLAFGVDEVAHETTLNLGGKTIAVLGSGVDTCTPTSHQQLYERIIKQGGLIISSFPMGLGSSKGLFPARNRIIAGLSQGIVVTEGTIDSGALITAKYAQEMNRPVFAIPGQITSALSGATNKLLKNGAMCITSGKDILDTLGIISVRKKGSELFVGADQKEREVLALLQIESLHFDEIVRRIGKDSKVIGSLLSLMELKGMIRNSSDGVYMVNF